MQKVIGLDIGSYSVKIVEILNSFNSYEIINFYENVIPDFDEVEADVLIPYVMEQLFRENDLKVDRIVTAMPGQFVSSRIMSFNFTDPRKVEKAVIAEVEDVVPYDMDDMIIDHQILGQVENTTMAMAVMTRKVFLKSFLDHLHHINIDPKLVDVDSLSFYNLNPYLGLEPGECGAIVDVGHEKISVCIVQDEVLRMFRSINLGGRYLTEFLSRDLELSFCEAQRVKHRISYVLSANDDGAHLSPEDKLIAQRITVACNAMVKELGRTFYSFKKWEKSPIKKIFLSGGTSRLKNLDQYFSDNLEIPVTLSRLDDSTLKINSDLKDKLPIMAQGISIGMRAISSIKRHSSINLRKGEFAYVQDYESIIKATARVFKFIAVAVTILIMTYMGQYFFYKKKIAIVQEEYKKAVVQIFPDLKKSTTTDTFEKLVNTTTNKFKAEIGDKNRAIEEFVARNNTSPALETLTEISKSIPKKLKIDLTLFQFSAGATDGEGKITIRGDTDSYESVAKILEALKTVKILTEVMEKTSSPKPGYDNKVIDFTIQGVYEAGEAEFGS